MKWFNNPQTLEELKKQYKSLAMIYHPDRGGNTADMQEINSEYDILFPRFKNAHTSAEGKTYTSTQETTETPDMFKKIIETLIKYVDLNIEICGTWLWITGNTREHKELIKGLGFRFSKNKTAWYLTLVPFKKRSRKNYSLDDIREMYGSQKVNINNSELKIAPVRS